ncbi:alanine racemase [Ascidiimonas aurantiaca]|uniref:alanine racemase n=1 Tax=Ascidiimonas aurantiaca TaxID=1685432 RepID=UPI0030EEABCA
MPGVTETVLEINLKALKHNLDFLRSHLAPDTLFMAVVKAAAYGNDAVTIARYLENQGVHYFSVAYVSEGVILRKAGITTPILVLHPQETHLESLLEHCLEPGIYSWRILEAFAELARIKNQKSYPVHFKFNTGLNRLGFSENDTPELAKFIKSNTQIAVKSLFSHLAASEDPSEKEFTLGQIHLFKNIAVQFEKETGFMPILHQTNTSGILNYPEAHFDMVRSGIGLYGYGNQPEKDRFLKPVTSLKTVISQIHKIKPGESVGYNRAFIAKEPVTIATLPLGHADGIGRQYGHEKGFVTLHGKKAPIVGNVCMDMLMVNVTGIPCKEGDEVLVFGENPSAHTFAATANTISYELITGISARVKRLFIS